jgi:hypothetical protein
MPRPLAPLDHHAWATWDRTLATSPSAEAHSCLAAGPLLRWVVGAGEIKGFSDVAEMFILTTGRPVFEALIDP